MAAAAGPPAYGQAALLALAIRQHPAKCISRPDLIKTALELDAKISKEKNTPRLFQGKTPVNSASAILSHNVDRYFEAFRPQDSPCLYYRLAHDQSQFNDALRVYRMWESQLVRRDWPLCFDVRTMMLGGHSDPNAAASTEFDQFIMARKQQGQQHLVDSIAIPTSWTDIVRVDNQSRLVAKRTLPLNTPLGFYFGVPMGKHAFAVLKEGIGKAAAYCVLYNKTILDPTDDDGELYQHSNLPLCPFHYMRETNDLQRVNVCLLEGVVKNQVICWTMRVIQEGEELMLMERK